VTNLAVFSSFLTIPAAEWVFFDHSGSAGDGLSGVRSQCPGVARGRS